jgi:ferrous-iron efflux pump FieF
MLKRSTKAAFNPQLAIWAGVASMVTVAVLIIIKSAAWMISDSTSILASLTDSIVDAIVSFMSFMAIRHSLKPADEDHRYGHGKIEGLMALLQAGFIGTGAVFLVFESVGHLFNPLPVVHPVMAVIVMAVSSGLSIILVAVQHYSLRQAPSLAVESDQAHYASDILVNGAVILALILQMRGAPLWTDPFFALLIALWLGRTAYMVAAKGVDMLLDKELPAEKRDRIIAIIGMNRDIHGFHDLRTRMSGMELYISFDVEIDPDITLAQAHRIAKDIEKALLHEFPNAQVMIHQDPVGETEDSRHKEGGVKETT